MKQPFFIQTTNGKKIGITHNVCVACVYGWVINGERPLILCLIFALQQEE